MVTRTVSVRDLRNRGGEVLDQVARGESVLVTRDGAPVAELARVRRTSPSTAELIARRKSLPLVDAARFRSDIDAVIDASL